MNTIYRKEGDSITLSCISDALIRIHLDSRYQEEVSLIWVKGDYSYGHFEGSSDDGTLAFDSLKPSD